MCRIHVWCWKGSNRAIIFSFWTFMLPQCILILWAVVLETVLIYQQVTPATFERTTLKQWLVQVGITSVPAFYSSSVVVVNQLGWIIVYWHSKMNQISAHGWLSNLFLIVHWACLSCNNSVAWSCQGLFLLSTELQSLIFMCCRWTYRITSCSLLEFQECCFACFNHRSVSSFLFWVYDQTMFYTCYMYIFFNFINEFAC